VAIGFARLEMVKRSSGQNACCKASYNARSRVEFRGHEHAERQIYDWSYRAKPLHHDVLLPKHVDSVFKDIEYLWNVAEAIETRKNSQVALEMVLALPDDAILSKEDRIELARSFVSEHFVDKGLGVQIDIHSPDLKTQLLNGKLEYVDHNWHAHVLVTTRRFSHDGTTFGEKARDLVPSVRKGKVVSGADWGKLWAAHQNDYFARQGLELRVDDSGVVPQLHIGPIRMRGRAVSMLMEQDARTELNYLESSDASSILKAITATRSVFTQNDVKRFVDKFVDGDRAEAVMAQVWAHPSVSQLLNPATGKPLNRYSTIEVIEEEKKAIRIGDRLQSRKGHAISADLLKRHARGLTEEQQRALTNTASGTRLHCVDGHAGTGKSFLLRALHDLYSESDIRVRAFGPDQASSKVLTDKGIGEAENLYKFLFAVKHGRRELKGRELWILDEAGKLGNRPLLELLKLAEKSGAQVILSGCRSQLKSVERGQLFAEFCKRYGSDELVDVQRQKDSFQRSIAKNLATGDLGAALDGLVRSKSLHWEGTRREAIESLIAHWAKDRTAFPQQSTLIVAHSNSEVRALNDMIHAYRKDRGELEQAEFECNTVAGKLYLSIGDRIEFRKNSGRELDVSNGTQGILVEASSECFKVEIGSGANRRLVSFDPRHYRHFSLGYARTHYRSQGETVDRAYVLHSPASHRASFYVGLTRHTKLAHCFIAREETSCMADLKRQVSREFSKETTVGFMTQADLIERERQEARATRIEALKSSESAVDRFKGIGASLVGRFQEKAKEFFVRREDRQENREFYSVPSEKQVSKGMVREVVFEKGEEPSARVIADLKPREIIAKSVLKPTEIRPAPSTPAKNPRKQAWASLSPEARDLFRRYYTHCDEASSIREIRGANGQFGVADKAIFAARNQSAHTLVESLSKETLAKVLSKSSLEIVQERAARHQQVLELQKNAKVDIAQQLSERMEELAYRLFPDGPTSRDRNKLRFGKKGSLVIVCHESSAGSYYDHEDKEGGGPVKLIQRELGLDYSSALRWSKEFLGTPASDLVPESFRVSKTAITTDSWKAIQPPREVSPPELAKLSKATAAEFREAARYRYADKDGNALFWVLRLEHKENSSQKTIRPVSYGYWSGDNVEPRWAMKWFSNAHLPLYRQEELAKHPNQKVLIVEGEKTAERAAELFPNHVCVTWSGGSGAVAKSDWSVLKGRDVVIWGDNDEAGCKAAREIISQLRVCGASKVAVVNPKDVSRLFPEKWDLADEIPAGLSTKVVQDLIAQAQSKTVGLDRLIEAMGWAKELKADPLLRMLSHQVLSRVEERLRDGLEQQHGGKTWEIDKAIVSEVSKILGGCQIEKLVSRSIELGQRTAIQEALHLARHGRGFTSGERSEVTQALSNAPGESKSRVELIGGDIALCTEQVERRREQLGRAAEMSRQAEIVRSAQAVPGQLTKQHGLER
jgi:Ti-type conjugative transfer relaxase TraA